MAYILVQNFKEGLDVRKSRITAPAGTLRKAKDVHITRGGEIEKRKAFTTAFTLPEGTFGVHGTSSALYVFGSISNPGVPSGLIYQRLQAPDSAEMTEVISHESYNGVPYVVAKFDDGNVYHFYNGNRVTAWDTISPDITDLDTLGAALTALINQFAGYSASFSSPKISITGPEDIPFSTTLETINRGDNTDNTMSSTVAQSAGSGSPQITEVTLSGTYESEDIWQIILSNVSEADGPSHIAIISGAASGVGGPLLTFGGKVYTTTQSLLYFSDINDPTTWDGSGAGFINMSNQNGGSETLTGLASYQGFLAVFSRHATQIWAVDPDPINNRLIQVVGNVGTLAPQSATNFGEIDVFFLSDTGIRSLRARDSSNNAYVYDVGTSIDDLVIEQMKDTGEPGIYKAAGVIEPEDGRYMLAIGDKIFVYSFFSGSTISAWTTYEPGFSVEDWAVKNNRLYARSGDTIYLYGGNDGETYDNTVPEVTLAWLDGGKPASRKAFNALDMACEGLWEVSVNFDPKVDLYVPAGSTVGETYSLPSWGLQGKGTHVGIHLTGNAGYDGYALLSSLAIHFQEA